jgi:benzylsuccinate CoA-transferase BbsF subunit
LNSNGRPLPLSGIRVTDFFWLIAGPATSRVLSDFGAEVIKIESLNRVDRVREGQLLQQPPGGPSLDTAGVFMDCNTNKLSVTLDLNKPRAVELAKDLVRQSDIVTNNFTGDRMGRWGLGYEDLRAVKPDIIMLSMPVMGTTGPYRNYGSYGNGVIAYGGLNMNMGFPDRPPVGMSPLYSDFAAPYFGVSAMMAALYHRERTGEGQFIDLSQVETSVSMLGTNALEFTANHALPVRDGNRSSDYCPHGAYRCAGPDRWLAIAISSDREFRDLCSVMERPELASDPRFDSPASRREHEAELDAVVETWTRNRDAWDAMRTLQAAGVMAGVVEDLEDMVTRDPWLSSEHLRPVARDDEDLVYLTHSQPSRFDGESPPLAPAPRLGEHNEYILKELLGVVDEEYEQLLVDEVIY